ncbi:hypothetical protein CRE_30477 [Caenorhabditis remanei]|uniref:G-protein coupled receptors family 2 profile 2 domain-containing protein n=1 Tax=Caenorhabditis remanei TaxID=31234 RepID=E3NGJ3_CAERE|nr:hypothetical protein CRE_30477 [Caenorhabditis remanei]
MVIMIATYIVVVIEIRRRGYHITVRKWLTLIGILLINVLLIIIPIIVIQCSLSNYTNEKLGWSCWLTSIAIGALFLLEFFRIRVKRQCIAT